MALILKPPGFEKEFQACYRSLSLLSPVPFYSNLYIKTSLPAKKSNGSKNYFSFFHELLPIKTPQKAKRTSRS
jgi:hypothetical protein